MLEEYAWIALYVNSSLYHKYAFVSYIITAMLCLAGFPCLSLSAWSCVQLAPENTMMSFRRSLECNVTAFETDVLLRYRALEHSVHPGLELDDIWTKLLSFSHNRIMCFLLTSHHADDSPAFHLLPLAKIASLSWCMTTPHSRGQPMSKRYFHNARTASQVALP